MKHEHSDIGAQVLKSSTLTVFIRNVFFFVKMNMVDS